MSKGVLVYARNNSQVDYIKQAYYLALQIKKYMNLPTSVATDSVDYLKTAFPDYETVFDNIIELEWTTNYTHKRYQDGTLSGRQLEFKNDSRTLSYDITPYEETLLLDTDYIVVNDVLLKAFEQNQDFLIYKTGYDLANFRDYSEFDYISDTSVDFYWATCVFFRKTETNKIFFDLLQHIQENWPHYNSIFQINSSVYRNDHAFSIAIHIMNGYQQGDFAGKMPGKLFYTTDRDIVVDVDNKSFLILVEKEKYLGEYTPIRFKDHNLHIMNKFSLNRMIDKELANEQ